MQTASDLLRLQCEQYTHDRRNHTDILGLSRTDRLKHYGLHFAKYVGRFARGVEEPKSVDRTLVDMFLVSLSAANALHQKLNSIEWKTEARFQQVDPIYVLADAAGRFADACEKVDHMEEFIPIALRANIDVIQWVMTFAAERKIELEPAIKIRRRELAERQFYITD